MKNVISAVCVKCGHEIEAKPDITVCPGDPTPSQEDILITKQIADAGELVGITLLDHIIIGDRIYRSIGIPVED